MIRYRAILPCLVFPGCILISAKDYDERVDPDGDGSALPDDCDDGDATIYPDAEEICDDGRRNDCDATDAEAVAACNTSGELTDATRLTTGTGEQWLGLALLGGADLSGDGRPDIAVGAPGAWGVREQHTSEVWLSLDGLEGDPIRLSSEEQCEDIDEVCGAIGLSLAARALDGEGPSDLLIGAPAYGPASDALSAVFVLPGPITPSTSLDDDDVLVLRPNDRDTDLSFGSALVAVDLGGDGAPWVVVGAPWADVAGTDAGELFLYAGADALAGSSADAIAWEGDAAERGAGWSLVNAGDMDGDGAEELVVGAPSFDGYESGARGRAWLIEGAPGGDGALADVDSVAGVAGGDAFGAALAGGADWTGDGNADVWVGAPGVEESGQGTNSGAIYLLTHASFASGGDLVATLSGDSSGGTAGWSLASPGDINLDGAPDLLVGVPYLDLDGAAAGEGQPWDACTYADTNGEWGGVNLAFGPFDEATTRLSAGSRALAGPEDSPCTGYAVAGAGDVDGNGLGDLLVGALWFDEGRGAAWLVSTRW